MQHVKITDMSAIRGGGHCSKCLCVSKNIAVFKNINKRFFIGILIKPGLCIFIINSFYKQNNNNNNVKMYLKCLFQVISKLILKNIIINKLNNKKIKNILHFLRY